MCGHSVYPTLSMNWTERRVHSFCGCTSMLNANMFESLNCLFSSYTCCPPGEWAGPFFRPGHMHNGACTRISWINSTVHQEDISVNTLNLHACELKNPPPYIVHIFHVCYEQQGMAYNMLTMIHRILILIVVSALLQFSCIGGMGINRFLAADNNYQLKDITQEIEDLHTPNYLHGNKLW